MLCCLLNWLFGVLWIRLNWCFDHRDVLVLLFVMLMLVDVVNLYFCVFYVLFESINVFDG